MEIVTLLGNGKSGVNAGVRRNLNLKTLQSMTNRNCVWQHGKLHLKSSRAFKIRAEIFSVKLQYARGELIKATI